MFLAAGDRPADERPGDSRLQRLEHLTESRHHACDLVDQAAEFGKQRRPCVGFEVGAGAFPTCLQNAAVYESLLVIAGVWVGDAFSRTQRGGVGRIEPLMP